VSIFSQGSAWHCSQAKGTQNNIAKLDAVSDRRTRPTRAYVLSAMAAVGRPPSCRTAATAQPPLIDR
jgi:hypothetical protein